MNQKLSYEYITKGIIVLAMYLSGIQANMGVNNRILKVFSVRAQLYVHSHAHEYKRSAGWKPSLKVASALVLFNQHIY